MVYNFIDISIGCGGSALGLEKIGFKLLFGISDKQYNIDTTLRNKPKWDVVKADIMKLDFTGYANDNIDLLIGTIPYSVYSVNSMNDVFERKRKKQLQEKKEKYKYNKICEKLNIAPDTKKEYTTKAAVNDVIKELANDDIDITISAKKEILSQKNYTKQSKHLFSMFRAVTETNVKMFVFDAVPSILRHDNGRTFEFICDYASSVGYIVVHKILDAWDYGVPQKRKRLIIVGINSKIYMEQNRMGNHFNFPMPIPEEERKTLRDAIFDLVEEMPEISDYSAEKKKIMALVPPGGCWINLPIDVQKKYLGKIPDPSSGGSRGIARRLDWDSPCLTLMTSPNQKQTDRCHPDHTRPLTVKEYSLVQSFPKKWKYTGSIANKYSQIGQSLPPLLMYRIGESIMEYFNKCELSDVYSSESE